MDFDKYHGIGNDFVMLADPDDALRLAPRTVTRLCDRRLGIGGDGVIRVAPGRAGGDLLMDYINSDGSVGEMCGNGIRCLALFALERDLATGRSLRVETGAGIKVVEIQEDGRVRVDMGEPEFRPQAIPVVWDGDDALHAKIELGEGLVEAACLSMGNPHAVLFVDDPATAPVTTLGPELEHHPAFPSRVNVEFVAVHGRARIGMRVWERGSGETLACGTGACAAAVAARLLRDTDPTVTVQLPGGELEITWAGPGDGPRPVVMTGPATKSFAGTFDLEAYR
ncbi:MAG: diaminopimelate epimerase [Actinobacteria bacterium]|nr:diaminopimelate epimerase [Actinomycetota bacterium]